MKMYVLLTENIIFHKVIDNFIYFIFFLLLFIVLI